MAINWRDLLSYSTAKIVKIRDIRLGLLHYGFMIAIVVYILVYTILIEQKYLITERPIGSIRLSLLKGKAAVGLESLDYCYLSNRTTLPNGKPNYPCKYQDEMFVVFPNTEATAMLATTRYTHSEQTLFCSMNDDPTCSYTTTSTTTYYIANIEKFTLLIDHTVYAPLVGIQSNAKTLRGSMSYYNGSSMSLDGPPNNVIGQKGQPDVIQLQTLLKAAGVNSLDDNSLVDANSTLRYDGLVLMIFIVYSNTDTYNLNDISYKYMPTLISETEFKALEPLLTKNHTREIYNRHGIRMIFVQDGLLGKFDFQATLLTFVSALGLLAVSTVIVDVIAIYFLPQKELYADYKYQTTKVLPWHERHAELADEAKPINTKPQPTY